MQLQRELAVGNRLRALERLSRSYIVEIHCVPENKREGLLNIMRNIYHLILPYCIIVITSIINKCLSSDNLPKTETLL